MDSLAAGAAAEVGVVDSHDDRLGRFLRGVVVNLTIKRLSFEENA